MEDKLKTERLILRNPQVGDAEELRNFYLRNIDHLTKWESVSDWPKATLSSIQNKIRKWEEERKNGTAIRFLLFQNNEPDQEIIGTCNFTQIFFGSFQACYLGYKIDQQYVGQGLMSEALEEMLKYIFEKIGLHRVMANYMPSNTRSANLLYRLGFQVEGFAQNYLFINDVWEDHVLTALSKERWSQTRTILK